MATTSMEDPMQRLPHDVLADVLADVLRRLDTAPRHLASLRCVCKTWRAVIDTRGLLRADLLPLSLSGILTHPNDETPPDYFALPLPQQPSTETPAAFDYLDTKQVESLQVAQHCNGLLLLGVERVLNPTTQQWARLPPPPPLCLFGPDDVYGNMDLDESENGFLVFDPAVSPHYQVLLINSIPFWPDYHVVRESTKEKEWPPSKYTLRVFSSKTGLWEKKQFMRQGEARGTVGDMLWTPDPNYCYAAYWRGALYVHQHDFAMRINLSSCTYQVICLPKGDSKHDYYCDDYHYLGKSSGGVYCAMFKGCGLQVWFLDETCGQMKWALKRDVDLRPLLEDDTIKYASHTTLSILGFHPYKETVFIGTPSKGVMAYQFDSFKTQDLLYLPMDGVHRHRIYCSFPYTPCRIGELSNSM